MKRIKAIKPILKEKMYLEVSVECPHCKTLMRGGIDKNIITMYCWQCNNPIKLLWETNIK
jgi:hypothetical protein